MNAKVHRAYLGLVSLSLCFGIAACSEHVPLVIQPAPMPQPVAFVNQSFRSEFVDNDNAQWTIDIRVYEDGAILGSSRIERPTSDPDTANIVSSELLGVADLSTGEFSMTGSFRCGDTSDNIEFSGFLPGGSSNMLTIYNGSPNEKSYENTWGPLPDFLSFSSPPLTGSIEFNQAIGTSINTSPLGSFSVRTVEVMRRPDGVELSFSQPNIRNVCHTSTSHEFEVRLVFPNKLEEGLYPIANVDDDTQAIRAHVAYSQYVAPNLLQSFVSDSGSLTIEKVDEMNYEIQFNDISMTPDLNREFSTEGTFVLNGYEQLSGQF